MIGASPSMRMTLPARTPLLYLLMPLCSRFLPSGVSSTACTPCSVPSSLIAGKIIAGPSYTFGLNRAVSTAVLALRPREFRYSSAGRTASVVSREIGTARSHCSCAFFILSWRVSSSRTSISLPARRPIRRSNSDAL